MKKLLALAITSAALGAPLAAQAQLSLGLRVGFAAAAGSVGSADGVTVEMRDLTSSAVPLQVDLLFKVSPQLRLGGYFSYAFAQPADPIDRSCDEAGVSCTQHVTRVGLEVTYADPASRAMAPWLGLGTGYEWNTTEGGGQSLTYKGWELVNLQGGADWRLGPSLSAGPFLMWSIGRYSTEVVDAGPTSDAGTVSAEIPDKKLHHLFQVGLRGAFDL
ncbi:MAG: hypothetical protein QM767_22295 [Anaeromyxobacter sp.]